MRWLYRCLWGAVWEKAQRCFLKMSQVDSEDWHHWQRGDGREYHNSMNIYTVRTTKIKHYMENQIAHALFTTNTAFQTLSLHKTRKLTCFHQATLPHPGLQVEGDGTCAPKPSKRHP